MVSWYMYMNHVCSGGLVYVRILCLFRHDMYNSQPFPSNIYIFSQSYHVCTRMMRISYMPRMYTVLVSL